VEMTPMRREGLQKGAVVFTFLGLWKLFWQIALLHTVYRLVENCCLQTFHVRLYFPGRPRTGFQAISCAIFVQILAISVMLTSLHTQSVVWKLFHECEVLCGTEVPEISSLWILLRTSKQNHVGKLMNLLKII
jgi:hypothetical protein